MKSSYTVSGMTCGHCANHVTEEVSAIPGVTGVHVSVEGPMIVESGERIPFDAIVAAVAEAGAYTVVEA
ncbi:MAG TPA: heavy-metal-associated domain-containing protein [Arachnia sp.]|nr:heavy-metal-associated domain-containing protein [Arachnia sp.]HMT84856.1 heavy-metal-associated domain-containing protein [Arachnia sp.]